MANHLIREKSPYLLMHKDNPVDWYPWGNEAFAKARREKKPIFLSIGYSTCHWCHVMARESFEDQEAADLLNREYVSIKVDREERPDVDSIYMEACQILNRGSGGWPLTILMTADQEPFWAGTYLPKEYLIRLLAAAADQWKKAPQNLLRTAIQMTDYLQAEAQAALQEETAGDMELIRQAADHYYQNYDPEWGGFSQAPKFPLSHVLLYLQKYAAWKEDPATRQEEQSMLKTDPATKQGSISMPRADQPSKDGEKQFSQTIINTLDHMSQGGIYDQLGGGFCRYATDQKWLVPHFEKMLSDNALLAMVYAESYARIGVEDHARICRETLDYVLREMRSPDGSFYTSQDADTQGVEGLYYTFTKKELDELLPPDQAALFCAAYGITEEGNFQGRNILSRISSSITHQEKPALPAGLREKVFQYRRSRMTLGRDDKILISWNGLMIWSLARCHALLSANKKSAGQSSADHGTVTDQGMDTNHGTVTDQETQTYLEAAEKAAAWILDHLTDSTMHLRAGYPDGTAGIPGKLDDYIFLIKGLIELYRITLTLRWLEGAVRLSEVLLSEFFDENHGGFYAYGIHDEKLLVRKKEAFDGGTPSGNSLALSILYDLFHYSGQIRFRQAWTKQIAYMKSAVNRYPAGSCLTMEALLKAQRPAREILCAGSKKTITRQNQDLLTGLFSSDTDYILIKTEDHAETLSRIAPFTKEIPIPENGALYYRCQNGSCSLPVQDPGELA